LRLSHWEDLGLRGHCFAERLLAIAGHFSAGKRMGVRLEPTWLEVLLQVYRERERERERDREREGGRERDRERPTQREREEETDRQRDRCRERERERYRQRENEKKREREEMHACRETAAAKFCFQHRTIRLSQEENCAGTYCLSNPGICSSNMLHQPRGWPPAAEPSFSHWRAVWGIP
jgi:hypothetical protein